MKLVKRGKIIWGHWSVDGRRFRVSSGTSDESLAKEVLATKYADSLRRHHLGVMPRRTWREAAERYLREHQHLKSYEVYVRQAEWWAQQLERRGVKYIDQITPDVVSLIRDKEYQKPKHGGYKDTKRRPGTVNRQIALLRAVVNAVYREYLWMPMGATPPLYRMIPGENSRIRYITPEEFERLLMHLPLQQGRAARLAVSTGLRQSNVVGMRWDQVDLLRKVARIDGVLMKNGESLSIPLNEEAMEVLRLQKSNNDTPWVFPGRYPGMHLVKCSHAIWSRACRAAGLEDFHWHDLRHTWASWLRQRGANIDVIQQLGGWKDGAMVQRYAHLSLDHLRGAASLVDTALAKDDLKNDTNLTHFRPRRHLRIVSG